MARAIDLATLAPETAAQAVAYVAARLRPADLAEIAASSGGNPAMTVMQSWMVSSRSWLIVDRTSLPIGVFGVSPSSNAGLGIAWMVGTEGVEREALSIARQTRRYVAAMHEEFPILWNFIDARNELPLRWLEWSGFRIVDATTRHGPGGHLFYEFTRVEGD